MLDLAALTLDARRLWLGEAQWQAPLAFIDLAATDETPDSPVLPPCPVIGLGDRAHPFAAALDAVIEEPFTAAGLAANVQRAPRAAAVLVDLLRLLPQLTPDAGLTAESLAYAALQGSEEHARWLAGRGAAAARPPGRIDLAREGDQLTVTLADPAHGNAIDRAMRDALHEAFAVAALDAGLRRIVLRGAGRSFCLGAELGEFGTTRDPATAHAIRMGTLPGRAMARCADRLEAHVQGGCVGAGLEMAAWARHLTAAPDAWFHLPELAMGLLPGAGGCVSLTRRIGRQRTALLVLSGRRISASKALDWGLVDAIDGEPPADDRGPDQG